VDDTIYQVKRYKEGTNFPPQRSGGGEGIAPDRQQEVEQEER
jgi:hypothetical protein